MNCFLLRSNPLGLERFSREEKVQIELLELLRELKAPLKAFSLLGTPPKKYKWSPNHQNAAVLMRYWKLRLWELRYSENYQETFDRWERQVQIYGSSFHLPDNHQQLDVTQVRSHLNTVTKSLRKIQCNSDDLRSKRSYDLLTQYDDDNNPATKPDSQRRAKIVQRTLQSEASREMHSKIRQVVKPTDYAALTKVDIPRSNQSATITPPGQVHQVLATTEDANFCMVSLNFLRMWSAASKLSLCLCIPKL